MARPGRTVWQGVGEDPGTGTKREKSWVRRYISYQLVKLRPGVWKIPSSMEDLWLQGRGSKWIRWRREEVSPRGVASSSSGAIPRCQMRLVYGTSICKGSIRQPRNGLPRGEILLCKYAFASFD